MAYRNHQQLKILLVTKNNEDTTKRVNQLISKSQVDNHFYNLFKENQQLFNSKYKKQHQVMLEQRMFHHHQNCANPRNQTSLLCAADRAPGEKLGPQSKSVHQTIKNCINISSVTRNYNFIRNIRSSKEFGQAGGTDQKTLTFNKFRRHLLNQSGEKSAHIPQKKLISLHSNTQQDEVQYFDTNYYDSGRGNSPPAKDSAPSPQNDMFNKTLFLKFLENKKKTLKNCDTNTIRQHSPVYVRSYQVPSEVRFTENYSSLDFTSNQQNNVPPSVCNHRVLSPTTVNCKLFTESNATPAPKATQRHPPSAQPWRNSYNLMKGLFRNSPQSCKVVNVEGRYDKQSPIHTNYDWSKNSKKRMKRTSLKLNPCETKQYQQTIYKNWQGPIISTSYSQTRNKVQDLFKHRATHQANLVLDQDSQMPPEKLVNCSQDQAQGVVQLGQSANSEFAKFAWLPSHLVESPKAAHQKFLDEQVDPAKRDNPNSVELYHSYLNQNLAKQEDQGQEPSRQDSPNSKTPRNASNESQLPKYLTQFKKYQQITLQVLATKNKSDEKSPLQKIEPTEANHCQQSNNNNASDMQPWSRIESEDEV